jgi:hypothetical protein
MAIRRVLHRFLLFSLLTIGTVPIFYFLAIQIGIARAATQDTLDPKATPNSFDRYVENVAFGAGEKLSFDINYGFINAGTASMEVANLIEYQNRPCYQIITRANSNSFFSSFFKVDDRVESIMDAIGLFSWRFEKNLREGNYRADQMYEFDQRRHMVYYKKDTVETEPYIQDALSALYFVRTQNLVPGKSIFVDNYTDGKKYALEVRVVKKERIKVPAGTFDCVVVEPLLQSVGVFKHEGKLTVWLTDDKLKMPVLMKSKVLVGSISAELTDYKLGDIEVF